MYENEENTDLLITLTVPDEEKVELFEVKDLSGKKRIFSKFWDGMVYFKFSVVLPPGIWSSMPSCTMTPFIQTPM